MQIYINKPNIIIEQTIVIYKKVASYFFSLSDGY